MNVCENTLKVQHTKFKRGNLYKGSFTGAIYLAISTNDAVILDSGTLCNGLTPENYEDVTDQYCLQKVK